MTETIRVAGGIIFNQGKILVAQRLANDSLAGHFEFPGGKIEEGESPEDCLRREIFEELGISDLRIQGHFMTTLHARSISTIELMLYLCETEMYPTHNNSHEKIVWAKVEELGGFLWAPADVPAVRKLMKGQ